MVLTAHPLFAAVDAAVVAEARKDNTGRLTTLHLDIVDTILDTAYDLMPPEMIFWVTPERSPNADKKIPQLASVIASHKVAHRYYVLVPRVFGSCTGIGF